MATLIIARLTFLEASRRKILLAGLVLGLAFLILFNVGFYFMTTETGLPAEAGPAAAILRNQVYNFLTNAGLYAVNFLSIAMGALVSADTLAGEINSGTIQSLVTKPVRRAEVVLGKWLGFAGLIALYLVLMVGGVVGSVFLIYRYAVPNVPAGIALMYLESLLIMTLTLACSSTLSTLATGGTIFGLYGIAFIGGWVEQIGTVLKNQTAMNIGVVTSLIIPSEALFRRAAYEMTSATVRGLGMSFGPMFVVSIPSAMMIVYAALYTAVVLGVAVGQFGKRDL